MNLTHSIFTPQPSSEHYNCSVTLVLTEQLRWYKPVDSVALPTFKSKDDWTLWASWPWSDARREVNVQAAVMAPFKSPVICSLKNHSVNRASCFSYIFWSLQIFVACQPKPLFFVSHACYMYTAKIWRPVLMPLSIAQRSLAALPASYRVCAGCLHPCGGRW